MHQLLLFVLFLLPLTVTAQPKVFYQKGRLVESPLVVQHGFRDGKKTEIPLPKGRWSVRYVGETKSTQGDQGVNIWLEESVSGKVSQFLTFQIYETNGKNWQVGTSCDFLLSSPRGSTLSGGCFGLSGAPILNHPTNTIQTVVREEYVRESVSIEKEALWLKGIADRRDGLAIYFNYAFPFLDSTKSHGRDFLARVRSGGTLPSSEAQLAKWFRTYGQSIVDGGIPQISPSATNPKYTRQGFSGAFRVVADDVHLGRTLGKFAVLNLKGKSIAVIDDRTAYGSGIAEEFKKGATSVGGTITAHEFTKDKASVFTTILTKIKANNPDVIFFGGMDDVAGPLLRQMNSMGIKAKFIGGDGICTNEFALLAREAMKDETVFCAEAGGVQGSQKEGMDKFRIDFEAKYNAEVQMYAPYVYDAVMVMAAAMVKAGSAEPAKYLPALKAIKYKGVTGIIEFDEKGDIKNGALTIFTYKNRQRMEIGVIR